MAKYNPPLSNKSKAKDRVPALLNETGCLNKNKSRAEFEKDIKHFVGEDEYMLQPGETSLLSWSRVHME